MPDRMFRKALRALGISAFEQSQLRHYLEEYRRNAFAVNAPTRAVEDVGGRSPEDLDSIVRRYVASRPEARRSVSGAGRARWNLARIFFTRPLDLDRVEREQGHPSIAAGELTAQSAIWRATHDLAAVPAEVAS